MKGMYTISSISAQDLDNAAAVFEDLITHHAPHAAYLFNWMEYTPETQALCVRLVHDIELTDGTTAEGYYPAETGWVPVFDRDAAPVVHEAVKRIRLSKRQALMPLPWQQRGTGGAMEAPL